MAEVALPEEPPALAISPEKICYVVVRAREFETQDEDVDVEPGSEPTEERVVLALAEEDQDDPVEQELTEFVNSLSEDEQIDLVALAWLGRGDGTIDDWHDLRERAADAHNERTAAYLLGIPLLPDYLEEALAAFGRSCEEFEGERL